MFKKLKERIEKLEKELERLEFFEKELVRLNKVIHDMKTKAEKEWEETHPRTMGGK